MKRLALLALVTLFAASAAHAVAQQSESPVADAAMRGDWLSRSSICTRSSAPCWEWSASPGPVSSRNSGCAGCAAPSLCSIQFSTTKCGPEVD